MTSKPPLIIVDADAIIAQTYSDDSSHTNAMTISHNLISLNAQFLYPATAILEAVTALQGKLNKRTLAHSAITAFTQLQNAVIEINQQTLLNAAKYFKPQSSKKNTMFDCVVLAVAEEYNADAIFSFDTFYKKQGFKLTSDLLKETK